MQLEKPAEIILKKCMGYKDGESVLIVTDIFMHSVADRIYAVYKDKGIDVKIHSMQPLEVSGQEPPQDVADEMNESDIAILLTSKSLTHTKARRDASSSGTRVASMPTATEDMINRCIDIDYDEMFSLNEKIAGQLNGAKSVRITTDAGTDLIIGKKESSVHGMRGGIYSEKGRYGNLPDGEVFLAPDYGGTNGTLVIDGSTRSGIIDKPINVKIKDGFAVDISGGKAADDLKFMLESLNNKDAFNIAELGIGTNPKAKLTGNVLEDEKILGTIHIAFGNNVGFGGKVDVPVHIDNVVLKPNIYLDGKKIMENGRFLI